MHVHDGNEDILINMDRRVISVWDESWGEYTEISFELVETMYWMLQEKRYNQLSAAMDKLNMAFGEFKKERG